VAVIPDRLREGRREDLGRVALLRLLEQIRHEAEMPELILEEALPNALDGRIVLIFHTAVVVINFGGLVQQPFLQPCFIGINNGLVLRDMLLLNGGDLRIELPGDRVGEHGANRHVVIMGLMFPAHDGECVQLGDQGGLRAIIGRAQVITGVAVLQ
jgi:hypothetical protein